MDKDRAAAKETVIGWDRSGSNDVDGEKMET
jgi:hypothetical protein